MRAGRLLSILLLLQTRVRLTAEELAREFGVSVRTIYRDVDELSTAGVPVFADRGPGGGFQLVAGYRTTLTGLGADEAEALLMAGVPGAADALGLGAAAGRAAMKLLASLPSGPSASAGRLGTRVHFDPVEWYHAAEPVPFLPLVARAVLDDRRLVITYESWTGVRTHRVAPLGVVLKASAWYLVAAGDDGRARIHRVSNIRAAELLDQTHTRPASFDLAAFWRTELVRFEAGLRPLTATLEVTDDARRHVARLGAYAAAAVDDATPCGDGTWIVRLPFETIEQGAALVLGLGEGVRATAPEDLRARVHALAVGVVARHDPTAAI
ncbi:MAG: WYL domain-containing protein [Vicinamibacterales bacterium]